MKKKDISKSSDRVDGESFEEIFFEMTISIFFGDVSVGSLSSSILVRDLQNRVPLSKREISQWSSHWDMKHQHSAPKDFKVGKWFALTHLNRQKMMVKMVQK